MSALTDFVKALINDNSTVEKNTELPPVQQVNTTTTEIQAETQLQQQQQQLSTEVQQVQQQQQNQPDYKALYEKQLQANQQLINRTTVNEVEHTPEEEIYNLMCGEYPKGGFRL